ncbi:hypothetical protein ACPV54_25540 [Vibrio mediterranei]
MPYCVVAEKSTSVLKLSGQKLSDCDALVVISASEYHTYLGAMELSSSDVAGLLFSGFGLVILGYLLAAPAGYVVRFINKL